MVEALGKDMVTKARAPGSAVSSFPKQELVSASLAQREVGAEAQGLKTD